MAENKWQLHRAGLFNFWYYDEEDFYFADGKLLLRGSNGSGKSVTMQSLIPVLLDGKKSPDRLDPFGSRARRMEDYLLGEKGVVDRDERTGYLFLEYKRQGTEEYRTTGIGLRAKRNSNIDFWGFIIHDNRRIGKDFKLYKEEFSPEEGGEQKIPLSRRELESRLGQGGKLVRTQSDYMGLVNKYIFGYENVEDYEELIKLLIQLRSPKLSKEFKPTVIYEILNESLPPIADDELRPLSDTIESMDQIKQQLEQLKREEKSLSKLCKQYDLYNQVVLAEKAEGLLEAHKKRKEALQKDKELKNQLVENRIEQDQLLERLRTLESELEVLKVEEKELKKHDAFQAEEQKQELSRKIKDAGFRKQRKAESLGQKQKTEQELKKHINAETEKQLQSDKDIKGILDTLEGDAEEAQFFNHDLAVGEFNRNYETGFQFDLWKKETQDYHQKLGQVLEVLRDHSRLKERYQEADKELGEAKKEYDLIERDEKKWADLFEEEKGNFLQNFHLWRKESSQLKLTEEEIQTTAQKIMHIYEPYRFEEAKEPIMQAYNRISRELNSSLLVVENRMASKNEEIEVKRAELREWKAKKDPEPRRHQATVEARKVLSESGVPFVPFFAAVEFHDNVTPEQRERIEAAITEMGILDALIVPEKYLTKGGFNSERVLKPKPELMSYTLADILYPTPIEGINVSGADIDNILRSIRIEEVGEAATSIAEDGSYQIGLLKGHAPKEEQAIYIGKESRRQFREREIARLEKELESLQQELLSLKAEVQDLKEQLKLLEEEKNSLPGDSDLHEAYINLQDSRKEKELRQKEVERKNSKVKEILDRLQQVRNQLRELTEAIDLEKTQEAYQAARQAMNSYREYLQNLELTYKDYLNSADKLKRYQENLEEVSFDVDELKGELNLIEGEIEKLNFALKQVEERLQELGAEKIRERISAVVRRLGEIPNDIRSLDRNSSDLKNVIGNMEKEISQNQREVELNAQLFELWKQVFREDARLQLVEGVDSEAWESEEKLLAGAKGVLKEYSSFLAQGSSPKEKIAERLNNIFFQEQGVLVEYRLTQERVLEVNLPDLENITDQPNFDTYQFQLEQLRQKSRRIRLVMEYNGKGVSPYYVLKEMENDLEQQQSLLRDSDRELYEEIIMNTVGRIIRVRISRAEQWVDKINKLMSERDTSSGLTFSLSWKPLTAEFEEEMDTKELVDLLRSNVKLLKEEDMERVTSHFRSKIDRAKELVEEKSYGETLHQIIKELLDYRKWFAFTLYYRREGEQKKELTNNVFFTFSGGEKAMAMYIPLFSAAYSRYSEARPDAPYIISLDEAFAGVDDNNIRDMFDLVEQLGFNYIINSQALWGDYDTVSSLAIYELVRPKNASYVTVVRYHWDGQVKHLLARADQDNLDCEAEESA